MTWVYRGRAGQVEVSLWGKPEKINRTITQYSEREQWVYGQGQYLYFKDGILTSFQYWFP